MIRNVFDLIDIKKVSVLLEGFDKTTGFLTAILDLDGNILCQSGWRDICTKFHRIHPETAKRCAESDTVLSRQMEAGEKYHFYKCLNGLVDVAVPIMVKGEHIANLFSGQFFFEEPERQFFVNQAKTFNFPDKAYLESLDKVPVVSKEKVKIAMDFLLDMTQLISEMAHQKSEQLELNDALKKSEERWQFAIEGNGDGLWDWNCKTNEVFYSKQWKKMLGFEDYEIGSSLDEWDKRVHPDDKALANDAIQHHIDGITDVYQNEHRLLCKDGTYKWILDKGKIVSRTEDGEPVRFIGTLTDISNRKKVQLKLIESETRFRTLIQQSPFVIEMYDAQGLQISVNKAYEDLWGFPAETTVNQFNVLKSKEVVETGLINYINKAYAGESVDVPEYQFDSTGETEAKGKGRLRWLSTRVYPLKDDNDKVTNVVIVHQDITDRKKAELELVKSEEKFRSFVQKAPIPMCHVDNTTGILQYVNAQFVDTFGYSITDMPSVNDWFQLVYPDLVYRTWVVDNWEKAVTDSIANQTGIKPDNYAITCKNGEIKQILVSGIILGNDLLATFVDLTFQKNIESELNKHKENLEKMVSERTAELKEKNTDLERMNKVFIGRELKMVELKEQIKALENSAKSK